VSSREGVSGLAYETIEKAFEETLSLLPAWERFSAQIVMRRCISGDDQFCGPESTEEAFNDANVIEPQLNRNFYMADFSVSPFKGPLLRARSLKAMKVLESK
jgi:hypothetical protein